MSNLQKDIILNGQDSIAVFKENGLVYRTAEIESYTPIVFKTLKANTIHQFEIGTILNKAYKVVDVEIDVKGDDDLSAVDEQQANNASFVGARFSIVRQGKRIFHKYLQLYAFINSPAFLILRPLDLLRITPNGDINSLTLICQPVYLENTIVVPEVMSNDSNNSGNENPSPEPVVD